jgi:hypothetical protein
VRWHRSASAIPAAWWNGRAPGWSASPSSNAIYQRIGYREVATAVEYRFR